MAEDLRQVNRNKAAAIKITVTVVEEATIEAVEVGVAATKEVSPKSLRLKSQPLSLVPSAC